MQGNLESTSPRFQHQLSCTLHAGTHLFRVHRAYRQAGAFNHSRAPLNRRNGRFDCEEGDDYPFYYAALTARTALFETIVTEAAISTPATIPTSAMDKRVLSIVELTQEINLISLRTAEDFASIGSTDWLVRALPKDYPLTRQWSRLLRAKYSWAQGLIWYSRKDPAEESLVLFGDRCPADIVRQTSQPSLPLDRIESREWLAPLLSPHQIEY
ncbi:RES family NAD+ phosphorylase [Spirillospora sp. NBC_00431]